MTEPLPTALEAAQLLVTSVHGPDYRLGTATAGHTCGGCGCASVETAPLLRIVLGSEEVVASFSHCGCWAHCAGGMPDTAKDV